MCGPLREMGTMCAFLLRSGDGEEKASGGASVVERGCENLKGSGEGETLGASGGEEVASYSERGCAKSYEAGGEIHIHHSKAAVEAQLAIGKFASDSKASWLRVRKGEVGCLFDEIQNLVEPTERQGMDGLAGPQRGSNRSVAVKVAPLARLPDEHRGEAYTPNAATRSRGRSASEAGQRSVAVRTARPDEE